MPSGIDPTVDYAFKRVFGSEGHADVPIDLLNAVLNPPAGKVVREVRFLNPFTEAEHAGAKRAVFDIRARDQGGRLFNLEMQRQVPWSFSKRALYYLTTLHGQQLLEGDYYETLCPTYSICFLGE